MTQLKRAAAAHDAALSSLNGIADTQPVIAQLSSCLKVGLACCVNAPDV